MTRSPTLCALPWMHLSTRPDGNLRVCCTANASGVQDPEWTKKTYGGQSGIVKNNDGTPANLNNTDLLTAWNNDYMRNIRKTMLAGEKPASCIKCYKEEDAGHLSKRKWETQYWSERFDLDQIINDTKLDGSVDPKIRYIDLRLGSKCQLSCLMCSPHDSSNWVSDWNKLYPQIQNENLKMSSAWDNRGKVHGANYNWHKKNPEFWKQLYDQIPNIYQLYFAGGEATIIEEHYTLLEECIKRGYSKQIELRYNSNGIELPDRLFKLWNEFKRVRFHYSIDSIGKMNEYIRYPSDWNHQVNQFQILDSTDDNVEVTIACTVMALNIYYVPDFIRWKTDQGFKKINPWPLGAGMLNFHFAYWPPQLNVKVLPQWFKDEVQQKFEDFYPELERDWQKSTNVENVDFSTWKSAKYGINRLKGLVSFMQHEDWSNRMPEFREYIKLMDSIRNQSFSQTFPEMAGLLDEKV